MIETEDKMQEKILLQLEGKESVRNLIDIIRSKKYNYSYGNKFKHESYYCFTDSLNISYENKAEEIENKIDCEKLLLSMSERTRAIFILYYFLDWNQQRIANLLECDRSSICKIIKQETLKLRKLVDKRRRFHGINKI